MEPTGKKTLTDYEKDLGRASLETKDVDKLRNQDESFKFETPVAADMTSACKTEP